MNPTWKKNSKSSSDKSGKSGRVPENKTSQSQDESPFPATAGGLDQARRACRFQMARIVNEVRSLLLSINISYQANHTNIQCTAYRLTPSLMTLVWLHSNREKSHSSLLACLKIDFRYANSYIYLHFQSFGHITDPYATFSS